GALVVHIHPADGREVRQFAVPCDYGEEAGEFAGVDIRLPRWRDAVECGGREAHVLGTGARQALCDEGCRQETTRHEREEGSDGRVRSHRPCTGRGIGPGGFEPPFPDPKSGVLPLDEGPAVMSRLNLAGQARAREPAPHLCGTIKLPVCVSTPVETEKLGSRRLP